MKRIFGTQIFRVWVPPFGVADICWVETPKCIHSEYTLSIGTTGLHENFSSRLCACRIAEILPFFVLLWLRPRWKLSESFTTTDSDTQTLMGYGFSSDSAEIRRL